MSYLYCLLLGCSYGALYCFHRAKTRKLKTEVERLKSLVASRDKTISQMTSVLDSESAVFYKKMVVSPKSGFEVRACLSDKLPSVLVKRYCFDANDIADCDFADIESQELLDKLNE